MLLQRCSMAEEVPRVTDLLRRQPSLDEAGVLEVGLRRECPPVTEDREGGRERVMGGVDDVERERLITVPDATVDGDAPSAPGR
jgi:hypothetical protein